MVVIELLNPLISPRKIVVMCISMYISTVIADVCYNDITILLTDINECLVNNGGCGHNCRNTIGSYNCYCNTGYRLHSDKHKCTYIGTYLRSYILML